MDRVFKHLTNDITTYSKADLSKQDFSYASIDHVNFNGSNLQKAQLCYSYFSHVDFSFADLSNADLTHSSFDNVKFFRTNMHGAKIEGDLVEMFQKDLHYVCLHLKQRELLYLRDMLNSGEIDGNVYHEYNKHSGLIGTIANYRKGNIIDIKIPYYQLGLDNLGELLFSNIKLGETPDNSLFAKIAFETIGKTIKQRQQTSV